MCSLELWHRQIEDLADDFRIVAFDHRGHGRSEAARGGDHSIEMLGSDIGAVLDNCVPDGERAVVAGHSTGAMALAAWATADPEAVPERLSGAAFVCTGLGSLIAESTLIALPGRLAGRRETIGSALLTSRARIRARPARVVNRIVHRIALGPSATPEQVALVARLVLATPTESRAAFGLTIARLDIEDAVESVVVPSIVIAGARDRLTPPSHSRRIAESLPQLVELTELPGVGHMAPVEAPDEVSGALRSLLEGD
jgi:pimeloyl-ACP methyl ester carboxylesterase